jgi:hypothetical protein
MNEWNLIPLIVLSYLKYISSTLKQMIINKYHLGISDMKNLTCSNLECIHYDIYDCISASIPFTIYTPSCRSDKQSHRLLRTIMLFCYRPSFGWLAFDKGIRVRSYTEEMHHNSRTIPTLNHRIICRYFNDSPIILPGRLPSSPPPYFFSSISNHRWWR